jgi:molybdate transport system ATP-binding protein
LPNGDVVVSHDLEEASLLCDHCAILDGGAIQPEGAPKEILERPRTPRVADIVGVDKYSG